MPGGLKRGVRATRPAPHSTVITVPAQPCSLFSAAQLPMLQVPISRKASEPPQLLQFSDPDFGWREQDHSLSGVKRGARATHPAFHSVESPCQASIIATPAQPNSFLHAAQPLVL